MTIEQLGNIGEFISSVAVLVSLVYLAIQIKRSTDTARTSTYQSVVSEFGALNRTLAASDDLSGLFIRAMDDFDSTDEDGKARVSQMFFLVFHNFENMYYQYKKGYLEEDVWLGWKRLMLTYHAQPGFQTWWKARSTVFSQSFVEFLRDEEIDQSILTYQEITKLGIDVGESITSAKNM